MLFARCTELFIALSMCSSPWLFIRLFLASCRYPSVSLPSPIGAEGSTCTWSQVRGSDALGRTSVECLGNPALNETSEEDV